MASPDRVSPDTHLIIPEAIFGLGKGVDPFRNPIMSNLYLRLAIYLIPTGSGDFRTPTNLCSGNRPVPPNMALFPGYPFYPVYPDKGGEP